jgi:argininosuccinate synthase
MAKESIKKVVLAYSGGLDTSVIIPWLKENYGCEVICFAADVGQGEDLSGLEERALSSGASKLVLMDLKEDFAKYHIFPYIQSGVVYEEQYLLGTSIARPIIARKQVEVAIQEGADAVAHGCTGKGNDQVRFEMTYMALKPDLKVIAPWREWNIKSREDALQYLKDRGIPFPDKDPSLYSRDANLWHISHEGGWLEDLTHEPKEDMFMYSVSPMEAPDEPTEVSIDFENGCPFAVNGETLSPAILVQKLNELGGKNGIGRVDLVENRLVGMKSHGVYETPGGSILMHAHRELESITLERETQHMKEILKPHYAKILYNGQYFNPVREALDAFYQQTQKVVNGTIKVKLYKGNIITTSRESANNLYSESYATFGESVDFDHHDAGGFIRLFGLSSRINAYMKQSEE